MESKNPVIPSFYRKFAVAFKTIKIILQLNSVKETVVE
jgi:hypothetical protein